MKSFFFNLPLASLPAKGDELHGIVPARIHIFLLSSAMAEIGKQARS